MRWYPRARCSEFEQLQPFCSHPVRTIPRRLPGRNVAARAAAFECIVAVDIHRQLDAGVSYLLRNDLDVSPGL